MADSWPHLQVVHELQQRPTQGIGEAVLLLHVCDGLVGAMLGQALGYVHEPRASDQRPMCAPAARGAASDLLAWERLLWLLLHRGYGSRCVHGKSTIDGGAWVASYCWLRHAYWPKLLFHGASS